MRNLFSSPPAPGAHSHFNLTEALGRRSRAFLLIFGLLLLAAVVLADKFSGWEISVSVFYLLPVSYFAWYFSTYSAVAVALVSAVSWLLLERAKRPHFSRPWIPYVDDLINLALFVTMVIILTEVKTLYAREREHSRQDFLTGVANKRAFYEMLSAERDRALRHGHATTLAYLDLDNFKRINDSFDHETGDELLITLARVVRASIRNTDFFARIGGDEFCILFPHTTSAAAELVLRKLQHAVRTEMHRRNWMVTLSIGAVTFMRPTGTAEEMIRRADEAMYSVKAAGRNNLAFAVVPG